MENNIKQLIDVLNERNILQRHIDFLEDIPTDLNDVFNECCILEESLYVEKHRWYEIAKCVIKLNNGILLGVAYINDIFSEQMLCSDCNHFLEFFEILPESKTIIKYKFLKNG